jgi:peptide subunit release factor 1 (eRF1)
MLTKLELKELASFMLQDTLYVSLYFNVDPKDNPKKDEWYKYFKKASRDILSRMTEDDKIRVQPDIELIDQFLKDEPVNLQRGLAIFSNHTMDFWKVYHTALPFTNQLVIEHDPYIKPAAAMLDLYQRYLVLLVRGSRARVLIADLGQIEELSIVINPRPEPDKSKDGKWGDFGRIRVEKQKEQAQKQLYKEVRTFIEKMQRVEGIERIIIGGTESRRRTFAETLPDVVKNRIVGEFAVEYNATPKEILKVCTPIMKDAEYRFERKALDELFNQGGGGDGSVIGLSDVLDQLQQGNIRKLYVMQNMVVAGMVCNNCGALTPERERKCPYCDGDMRKVDHMLDLAIQKAIDQDARIDMLEEAPRLVKAGGIGALLRY